MRQAQAEAWFRSLPPAPPEPTALEELAFEARVSPEAVRAWLRREIERRRAGAPELHDVAAGHVGPDLLPDLLPD